MASQSKSDAARANGAKSKGPTTTKGKARSSQNGVKHGLTSGFGVLPGESQEDFDALLESHQTLYQPSGAIEQDLVHTLAMTRWRLRRIPTLESNVLENETILREEEIDEEFSEIDDSGRLGFVFGKLADRSKVLSLLIRYESSLTRTHDRTFKHLVTLQKLRNEPKRLLSANPPIPDPPAVPAPCVSVGLAPAQPSVLVGQAVPPAGLTSSPPSTPQSQNPPEAPNNSRPIVDRFQAVWDRIGGNLWPAMENCTILWESQPIFQYC